MKKYIEHIMNFTKETKGTRVFTFEAEVGTITFYVPKLYLKGDKPDKIKVTVEEVQ